VNYASGDWQGPVRASGYSTHQLWLSYFALGGYATETELNQLLTGASRPSSIDHNLIAHARNERLHDLGQDTPVPYREQGPPTTWPNRRERSHRDRC
jgi:hypothetical protein